MRKRIFLFLLTWPVLMLAGFFVFSFPVLADEYVIDTDTTWTDGQVIVADAGQGITINASSTLTIEAGAIIKFGPGKGIAVSGNLIIAGEPGQPVILTSVFDDTAGGDTNGDADATSPGLNDWQGIVAGELTANVSIDYAQIKYGGQMGALTVRLAASFEVNHSDIINNNTAVMNFVDNFKINNSNIYNPDFCQTLGGEQYCGSTVMNRAGPTVDLTNNYWGDENGPTVAPPDFAGTWLNGSAQYEPHASELIVFEPASPPEPEPVIIVPGILGSWQIAGQWKIDPIRHTYDNLIEALIKAGYVFDDGLNQNPTLFVFPYDWRVNNMQTAELLKEKINEVKQITGRDKVDIVAHSMGGLVARYYTVDANYQNDIDQVIFLGTPHLGSPKSYISYEAGEFVGDWGWFYKYYFQMEALYNGYFNLVDYIHDRVPTVGQLLPVYDYLKNEQDQLRTYYIDNYPRNTFLEYLNLPEKVDLLKQRINLTNIVSNNNQNDTINFIKTTDDPDDSDNKWINGYPQNLDQNENSFQLADGDGTVPYTSANSINDIKTVELTGDSHNDLPTTAQQDVIEALLGTRPTEYYVINNLFQTTKWQMTYVLSPVDFVIIDPNGHKVGKDFNSESEVNEIKGAFYSGFNNGPEFVLIPNPTEGDYTFELQGVSGGGHYTAVVANINNNNDVSLEYEGTAGDGESQELDFNYGKSVSGLTPPTLLAPDPKPEPSFNAGPVVISRVVTPVSGPQVLGVKITNWEKEFVQVKDSKDIYYIENNQRYLVPDLSLVKDNEILIIDNNELFGFKLAGVLKLSPGSLVNFTNSQMVFKVMADGRCQYLGKDKYKNVINLPSAYEADYRAE